MTQEELRHCTDTVLRSRLITPDGQGVKIKAFVLDLLLERAQQAAYQRGLNANLDAMTMDELIETSGGG